MTSQLTEAHGEMTPRPPPHDSWGGLRAQPLTKEKFEEFLRGTPAELMETAKGRLLKGEFVVLVDNSQPANPTGREDARVNP